MEPYLSRSARVMFTRPGADSTAASMSLSNKSLIIFSPNWALIIEQHVS